MATARDADAAQGTTPTPDGSARNTRGTGGWVGAIGAIAGCLCLVCSLFLPWSTVTRRIVSISVPAIPGDATSASSWAAYPLTSVTNVLIPLLLLPGVSLIVSLVRSLRRGAGRRGTALALALLGVLATVIYAFLLAVASFLSSIAFVPGHTNVVAIVPAAGLWLALAGSLLALASVVAAREPARRGLGRYASIAFVR